jgi:hypothetical protein
MGNDSVGVSPEYCDAMISRFGDDIRLIRGEIEAIKQNHVHRSEMTTLLTTLKSDIDRIERQTDARFADMKHDLSLRMTEIKTDMGLQFGSLREDMKGSNERLIAVVSVVMAIITVVLQIGFKAF